MSYLARTDLDLSDVPMSLPEEEMCRQYVADFAASVTVDEQHVSTWAGSRFGGNQRRADIIASFVWRGVSILRDI